MEELVGNHSNVCQTHSVFYSVRQENLKACQEKRIKKMTQKPLLQSCNCCGMAAVYKLAEKRQVTQHLLSFLLSMYPNGSNHFLFLPTLNNLMPSQHKHCLQKSLYCSDPVWQGIVPGLCNTYGTGKEYRFFHLTSSLQTSTILVVNLIRKETREHCGFYSWSQRLWNIN